MNEIITEEEMLAIQSFAMPQATIGQQVLWFRNGVRDRTSVEVAWMLHCGNRTATLHASSGRRVDAVRHIDDPKLKLNRDQRENGAWDFTEDQKQDSEFREGVLQRLKQLEKDVASLITKSAKVTDKKRQPETKKECPPHLRAFHALRAKAVALGVSVSRDMALTELQKLVDELESSQAGAPVS